jgi:hypothetical protein
MQCLQCSAVSAGVFISVTAFLIDTVKGFSDKPCWVQCKYKKTACLDMFIFNSGAATVMRRSLYLSPVCLVASQMPYRGLDSAGLAALHAPAGCMEA